MKKIVCSLLFISIVAFSGCSKISEEAKKVQDMIANLPETYSQEMDQELLEVCEAFECLSEEDQQAVDNSLLETLKKEKAMAEADEINTQIDDIVISNTSYDKLNASKKEVSGVMDAIADLSADADVFVNYDVLLEKINDMSNEYANTLLDADNDIKLANNILETLQKINYAYSTSSKYGYACDISSDRSKLSSHCSELKSSLAQPVEDLENACLYGEDYEVSLAVIEIAKLDFEVSFYDGYLDDSTFMDKCLEWRQIVQQKIDSTENDNSGSEINE